MNYRTAEENVARDPARLRRSRPRRPAPARRRIVFVTDIVTPYTVAVMDELAQLADLTVIFSAPTSARGSEWIFGDLSFRHVVIEGLAIKRADPDVSDYYLDPRIMGHLARVAPEVIICAGWSVPTWYAALYCAVSRSALVIHSDGTPLTERSLSTVQRGSRSLLVRRADGFAANSRQAAQRFIDLGAAPATVHAAPHSTRLEPFWEVGRRRSNDDRLGSAGALHVLMAGRLVARKGFAQALPAIAAAQAAVPGIHVSIAGSGPEEATLRRRARELGASVDFLGFVDQPDLAAAAARADTFVFPSTQDEFGFVLLEAMAAGLACIASPFAGATGELIVDGDNGLVVGPGDDARLSQALLSLAGDPALRRRLGERAHRSSLHRTPRRTAEGYLVAAEAARRRAGWRRGG
jgi:glycosyltransferase involved in cell wall biosynthesis